MPLQRPALSQIIDRVRGDIRSILGIKTILRRTFLGAISRALSGQSHVLHGNIEFLSKNLLPGQEADQSTILLWGSLFGINRAQAQKAELNIKILGDEGEIIPAGTQWQNEQGAIYIQDQEKTIPSPVSGVAEETLIETIADSSKSLAGKYFFLNTPATEYVVYFKVDSTGSDPNLTGKTSIQVDVSEDDTANDNANALQTILDSTPGISATVSTNQVTVTNDDTGSVEAATDFDTGFDITVLTQGVDEVLVEALAKVIAEDAGENGNVDNGEFLSLVSAIAGVQSDAEVVETLVEGEEIEEISQYRSRIISRIQEPPSGGNVNDYEQRALTVPGITRAWVYPNFEGEGTGTVGVTFVQDNESDIIPSATKVNEVQSSLNARDFKPITAKVTAFAPTPLEIDLVIKIKPNTQAVRQAIETELKDLIFRDAAPKGAYKNPDENFDGKILLSRINESISRAQGEQDHEIDSINSATPENIVPTTDGEIVQLGTISWQALA